MVSYLDFEKASYWMTDLMKVRSMTMDLNSVKHSDCLTDSDLENYSMKETKKD